MMTKAANMIMKEILLIGGFQKMEVILMLEPKKSSNSLKNLLF
jgi:hypothetical protein